LLGRFAERHGSAVSIATKFAPYRYRLMRGARPVALWRSLGRLRRRHVELYQIHWPSRWVSIERWMTALARTVHDGTVASVGVSNYSRGEMLRAEKALAHSGLVLASNQVQYSLLCREPETNGVADLCKQLGATLIAYSPLGMGLLTGKYSPDRMPAGGNRSHFTKTDLARIGPLLSLIGDVGAQYGGKTPSQVALNWVICKGAVPIPGVKNKEQAVEALGALGWRLSSSDVAALDEASSGLQSGAAR
jgi:aryl-alcohol dehydrogenase-like predicted oxidoreductase